jgi:hypothetical protein
MGERTEFGCLSSSTSLFTSPFDASTTGWSVRRIQGGMRIAQPAMKMPPWNARMEQEIEIHCGENASEIAVSSLPVCSI